MEAGKLLASKWFRMLTKSWICDGLSVMVPTDMSG